MLRELLIEIGIDIDNGPLSEMNKEIQDLTKRLKKLNVSKIEDLDELFENMVGTTKIINKNLKKMEKEFKDVHKSAKKVGRDVEEIVDGIHDANRHAEDLNDAFRDTERRADRVADNVEEVSDNARETSRNAERLSDSFRDAERQASNLASEVNSLSNAFREVTGDASRLQRELKGISLNGLISDISRLEGAFGGVIRAAQRTATETTEIGTNAAGAVGDVGRLDRAFDRVDSTVNGIGDRVDEISGNMIGLAGGLGAGIGAQSIIDKALESSTLDTKIEMAVSPNIDKESKKAMRESIKTAIASGVDEETAFDAARKQFTLNQGSADVSNQEVLSSASAIAKAFPDIDMKELIQEANEFSSVLGTTDNQAMAAFDHLFKNGYQVDQLDTLPEYLTQTMAAGFSEVESLAIAASAAATDSWNVDNLMDGIKEGRLTMMGYAAGLNKSQKEIVKGAGLSQGVFEGWGKSIAEGGEEGSKAMMAAVKHLDGMKDGVAKSELATMIFGTKFEDQNLDDIINTYLKMEEHMTPLTDMQKNLNDSVNTMNADPAVKLAKAFSDINEALKPLYEKVVDIVAKFAEWVSENPKLAAGIAVTAVGIGILGGALAATVTGIWALVAGFHTLKGAAAWAGGRASGPLSWLKGKFGRTTPPAPPVPLGNGRNGNDTTDPGRRNTLAREIGNSMAGQSRAPRQSLMNHWPDQNNPNNPWTQMERNINNNTPNRPIDFPDSPIDDRSLETAGRSLQQAATELKSAATMLKNATRNTPMGPGSGGGRNGDPNGTTRMVNDTSRQSGGKWYNKIGKVAKGGGILGLALGGVSLAGSLASGDTRSAAGTGGALAGGAAGAATGAALGSIVPGIGTAIGGLAGGIVGSVAGSSLGTKLYDGIKSFDWNGLKSVAESTKTAISSSWNSLKASTDSSWSSIKTSASGAISQTKTSVSSTASTMKSNLSSAWSSVKSNTGSAWSDVNSSASNAMSKAKTTVSSTASALKTGLSATFNATKTASSRTWDNLKNDLSSKSSATKTLVSSAFNGLKGSLSSTWSSIKSSTSSAWSNIASSISSSVSSAVSTAKTKIAELKGAITNVASNAWTGVKNATTKVKNRVMGSHATGLDRVPFDGYVAELHKNEAVLTANQANTLRTAGMLKGDGTSPVLAMPQATAGAVNYNPLAASPSTTTSTTSSNMTVKASININVDGSKSPQQTAFSIKEELEAWFSSLGDAFPVVMEG